MKYFEPFKGRRVDDCQRVQVYRNLNQPGVTYSIRDVKTGLVIGRTEAVLLSRCEFVVREAGRQRVHLTGKKNVHAWVEGNYVGPYHMGWEDLHGVDSPNSWLIGYNPWKYDSFVDLDAELRVAKANLVLIYGKGISAHSVEFKEPK